MDVFLLDQYTELVFEVHHAPGYRPSESALAELVEAAEITKKSRIQLSPLSELSGWAAESRAWDLAAAHRLIDEVSARGLARGEYGEDGIAVIHVYYLLGTFSVVDRGTRYDADGVHIDGRILLFNDTSTTGDRPDPFRWQAERRALIHEFGHAIGLVNCGVPMTFPRQEPGSQCHSTNRRSVMGIAKLFFDPDRLAEDAMNDDFVPWRFDEHDLADVRAYQEARSRAPPVR